MKYLLFHLLTLSPTFHLVLAVVIHVLYYARKYRRLLYRYGLLLKSGGMETESPECSAAE